MSDIIAYFLNSLRWMLQAFNYLREEHENKFLTVILESSIAIGSIVLTLTKSFSTAVKVQFIYFLIIYFIRDIKNIELYIKKLNKILWILIPLMIGITIIKYFLNN